MSARAALLAIALLATGSPALPQGESTDPIAEAGRINARLAMEYLKRGQLQVAQDKIGKALAQNPKDVNVQLNQNPTVGIDPANDVAIASPWRYRSP